MSETKGRCGEKSACVPVKQTPRHDKQRWLSRSRALQSDRRLWFSSGAVPEHGSQGQVVRAPGYEPRGPGFDSRLVLWVFILNGESPRRSPGFDNVLPVKTVPIRANVLPVNTVPIRANDLPVKTVPICANVLPVNTVPIRANVLPVNTVPIRANDLPVKTVPICANVLPVNTVPIRANVLPVNTVPIRANDLPVKTVPIRANVCPLDLRRRTGEPPLDQE
uniref:Uncharacterized protein n=1 Tax=Timema monikensis TaxID=170555 RepID=A0A7R9HVI8_9NEOP|nr:unnamed protein product [Timema monikensis]